MLSSSLVKVVLQVATSALVDAVIFKLLSTSSGTTD